MRTQRSKPPYHFNWLSEHLHDAEEQRLYAQEIAVLVGTQAVVDAMEAAHLSRAELAKRIGKSKGFVSQVLSGSRNMTLRTLGDLLWACDREMARMATIPLGQCDVPKEAMDHWLDCEPVRSEGESAVAARSTVVSGRKTLELRVDNQLVGGGRAV